MAVRTQRTNTYLRALKHAPTIDALLFCGRENSKGESKDMEILNEISIALQQGKINKVCEVVQSALDIGISGQDILDNGLVAGMGVIGEKFKNGEAYIPEVMLAAKAMNSAMDILKPQLNSGGFEMKGKAVLGTIKGDVHDIGKNIVKIMFEGRGIEVIDLGVDVEPQKFIDTAIEQGAKIVGCSALLTTTMPVMKDVVNYANGISVREKIKIMVGGAPLTQEFCEMIGADCYAPDAASAADKALEFLDI